MTQDSHVSLDGKNRSFRTNAPRGPSGPVCCIFSTSKSHNPGKGTTLRGHGSVNYWLVRQTGECVYGVRGVDGDYLPFGDESTIQAEELITHYTPEVAVFEDRLLPALRQSDLLYDLRQGPGAYRSALAMDEPNVRGLFELGMEYLLAKRAGRGRNLLNELLRVKTPFPGKNQFLFNEFGINLRKIGFPEGAVICYRRALKYTDVDDHLFYNLARAYYEQGQWWDCMNALSSCFDLNPELPLARDLVILIAALGGNPTLRLKHGKPPVPAGVARQADVLCEAIYTTDSALRGREEMEIIKELKTEEPAEPEKRELWLPGRDAVGL